MFKQTAHNVGVNPDHFLHLPIGTTEDVFRYVSTLFAAQEDRYRPYVAQNGTGCRAAGAVGAVTLTSPPGFELVPGNPGEAMTPRGRQ